MMPTEQADRIARVYSAVGIGRELRTSNFLLALMAAAAEHYRNEAEDRIEELEGAAEIVSEEFEGDCWKAVRTLLERVGWTDFSEGVTAQDACEIIGDAIHESRARAQALTAERDGLREARDQEDIGPPTPLGALKFRMEQGGHTQNDLAKLIGNRARASEILSGKRALSKAQIATLADAWGIPARSLLGPTPPAPHSDEAGS